MKACLVKETKTSAGRVFGAGLWLPSSAPSARHRVVRVGEEAASLATAQRAEKANEGDHIGNVIASHPFCECLAAKKVNSIVRRFRVCAGIDTRSVMCIIFW
mmetsp:Transcript_43356/g.80640  ORF Transcript_43356/g.80640 Transcript_43356/m.80640 type:complete len:102 (-) Transcript_43356:130-435(-)